MFVGNLVHLNAVLRSAVEEVCDLQLYKSHCYHDQFAPAGVYSVTKAPHEWSDIETLIDNNYRNMLRRDTESWICFGEVCTSVFTLGFTKDLFADDVSVFFFWSS